MGLVLARKMFIFALDQAKSRGFEWAWLGVWERNFKAQDFYYRFGFERFSETPVCYRRYRGYRLVVEKEIDLEWTRNFYSREGEVIRPT